MYRIRLVLRAPSFALIVGDLVSGEFWGCAETPRDKLLLAESANGLQS